MKCFESKCGKDAYAELLCLTCGIARPPRFYCWEDFKDAFSSHKSHAFACGPIDKTEASVRAFTKRFEDMLAEEESNVYNDGKSFYLKDGTCPFCTRRARFWTVPHDGDISICLNCGFLGTFKNGAIVELPYERYCKLDKETQEYVRNLQMCRQIVINESLLKDDKHAQQ